MLENSVELQRWIGMNPRRARFLRVTNPDVDKWPRLLANFVDVRAGEWFELLHEMRHAAVHLQDPAFTEYIQASELPVVLAKAWELNPEGLRQFNMLRLSHWRNQMDNLVERLDCLSVAQTKRVLEWAVLDIADSRYKSVLPLLSALKAKLGKKVGLCRWIEEWLGMLGR